MDIALCAEWTPFATTDLDDVVAQAGTALRAAGHQVEEIRIPAGSTEEGRLGAELAWRMVPVLGDLAITIGPTAYHLRHARKVIWLLGEASLDSAALRSAQAVFAAGDDLAQTTQAAAGVAVEPLLPTDAHLAARLVGASR